MSIAKQNLRNFSLGTWVPCSLAGLEDKAALLGKAVLWLVDHRFPDGTWGGPDAQERFETTFQVAQTLLMVGISPESSVLKPALTYLLDQDVRRLPTTFWRAGTFINIPGYEKNVMQDLEFGWREPRAGLVEYSPPLFLLKCFRFLRDPSRLSFTSMQIVERALDEWSPEDCWSGRASLTSMGMALLYDLKFRNRENVLKRCRDFLLQRASAETAQSRPGFAESLSEDCYVTLNICERPFVFAAEKELATVISRRVKVMWDEQTESGFWVSDQPFGGTTAGGGIIEPTAMAVRALACYYAMTEENFVGAIAGSMLEQCAIEMWGRRRLYPVTEEVAAVGAETAGPNGHPDAGRR